MGLFTDLETLKGKAIDRAAFIRSVLKIENRIWPQSRAEAAQIIEGLKGWIGAEKLHQLSK